MLTDVHPRSRTSRARPPAETYDADRLAGLDPADGRPLLARYDLERAGRTLTREALAARRAGGLWRWAELLPVRDPAHRLHLGEGGTPLLPAPRLGRELGVAAACWSRTRGSTRPARSRRAGWPPPSRRALELGATGARGAQRRQRRRRAGRLRRRRRRCRSRS